MQTRVLRNILQLSLLVVSPISAQQKPSIILATTTSTYDSGLLDSLVPAFEEASGIRVKIIAVGTGAALDMARRGDADAVLVHAPPLERQFVASGDLADGHLVMHNDFVIVGPVSDPGGVTSWREILCAMRAMARSSGFVSRGDRSGTHLMELALWRKAGVTPDSMTDRVETGQGMGATLDIAEQRQAYTLSDRGTFLAHRSNMTLRILFEGDPSLLNIYHVYIVNPGQHPAVKAEEARRFVAYLVSPAGQDVIRRFGVARFGQSLFVPDAARDSTTLIPAVPQ
jgi:tungstate transport system substrate-binding protein